MSLLRRRTSPLILPLCTAALLEACSPSDTSRALTVRDSAGVTIADNAEAAWGSEGWILASEPSVSIGTLAGDSGQDLHEPRYALRLRDGTFVIGDQGRVQLRYYDAAGKPLTNAGGPGGGPGEFARIAAVFRLDPDSVAVFDDAMNRITIFDAIGEHVRSISLPDFDRSFRPQIEGRRTDGSYVAYVPMRSSVDDLPDGLSRDSAMLVLFADDGALLDTLVTFANGVRDVAMRSVGGNRFRSAAPVVFSPRTAWTVDDSLVYLANSESYEVRVVGTSGDLTRIIRRSHKPLIPTEEDRRQFLKQMQVAFNDRLTDERMAVEVNYLFETIEQSPLPETFPAFDPDVRDDRGRRVGKPLMVDALGNLWVLEYRRPNDPQLAWSVFDPDGRYLGVVRVPERFYVTEVGTDYVLGWTLDELDVAKVELYALKR